MKTTFSRAVLFGVLVCVSSSPSPAAAAGFQITASVTSSNLNLKTTTVPAGRLAWFEGNRPDAITNLIQREVLPAVQHDLSFAVQAPAAFFRAAMLDTNAFILNVERAPLASGGYFSVAITTEGIIKTWGGNYHGEFGNGLLAQNVTNFGTHVACWTTGVSVTSTNNGPGPVQQSFDTDWISVAAGSFHTLALKADGSLWGWGDNSRGQLGDVNPGIYCSPIHIGADQLWNVVFACGSSSFAIRRDGTLWAWGANGGSVLGLGLAYTNSNSVWAPTQAGTASNWVKVVVLQEEYLYGWSPIRRLTLGVGGDRSAVLRARRLHEQQRRHPADHQPRSSGGPRSLGGCDSRLAIAGAAGPQGGRQHVG